MKMETQAVFQPKTQARTSLLNWVPVDAMVVVAAEDNREIKLPARPLVLEI